MKRLVWLTAGALVALACTAVVQATAVQGNPKLEGAWELVKVKINDMEKPAPAEQKTTLTFKGNKVIARSTGKPDEEGTFTVDDNKMPQEINFTKFGKSGDMKAIYQVQGDTLTMAVKGVRRPAAFNEKEALVLTLKKAK